jgi:hypothetical protein
MSDAEPVGPGGIEPVELLTPEQMFAAIQAKLLELQKAINDIREAVAGSSGRGLGH